MDAVIRYCFKIDPEKIEDMDKYAKLYNEGKFILDYVNNSVALKQVQMVF